MEEKGMLPVIAIAGNNPFLLHVTVYVLQGVKAKVPFAQFLLSHG
jgi:hypothetical protein